MSNNTISSFEEVEKQLRDKKKLSTVYFEGNPIQRDHAVLYRNKIRLALPQVSQIDASGLFFPFPFPSFQLALFLPLYAALAGN